ncbi:MAG TPA: nucleotide exchange factor GrpE [Nitrospirota bacterium]
MNTDIEGRDEEREVIPSEAGEAGTPASADEVQQLKQALEQKTREVAEANDKYLRAAADFDNFRKRMQRELADFRKYANEQMAQELLTVVDHLGLALKHAAESGDASQGLRQGVELVYKQLNDVLEKFGITRFVAEGEPFDPVKHEALMQVETADAPENTVVQVLQDGYLYHEKVLRHAKVGVSKKPAA